MRLNEWKESGGNESLEGKVESGNVSNVVVKFSQKFSRFKMAGENARKISNPPDENRIIQAKINESEEERILNILKTYEIFRFPSSKEIEDDEEVLFRCYTLFKSVLELNKSAGTKNVFVKNFEIENPLVRKDYYSAGKKFIFLQAWMIFEKGVKDFVPVLDFESEMPEKSGRIRLDFVDFEKHSFSSEEREILAVLRKNIYS